MSEEKSDSEKLQEIDEYIDRKFMPFVDYDIRQRPAEFEDNMVKSKLYKFDLAHRRRTWEVDDFHALIGRLSDIVERNVSKDRLKEHMQANEDASNAFGAALCYIKLLESEIQRLKRGEQFKVGALFTQEDFDDLFQDMRQFLVDKTDELQRKVAENINDTMSDVESEFDSQVDDLWDKRGGNG